jgi:hypothetical protein
LCSNSPEWTATKRFLPLTKPDQSSAIFLDEKAIQKLRVNEDFFSAGTNNFLESNPRTGTHPVHPFYSGLKELRKIRSPNPPKY